VTEVAGFGALNSMKSYFFVLFIFLIPLSSSILASTEEDVLNQRSEISRSLPSLVSYSVEGQEEERKKGGFDPGERAGIWVDPMEKESDTFQTKFFNMLLILGLLIGFMVLASLALKRLMKAKITHLNTESGIKLLETRSLSPRTTLYLVEVQDQTFLIADSPTSITPLPSIHSKIQMPPTKER